MANKDINKLVEAVDGDITVDQANEPEYVPVYQMFPDSKIAVAPKTGSFWRRRMEEGVAQLEQSKVIDRWEESIRYYQNDQGGKSNRRKHLANAGTGTPSEQTYVSENIVFANISALVPAIYAKNPDIEITDATGKHEAKAQMHEALIDVLFNRKVSPGINLKSKMRKATVLGMLTNLAYLELSYIKKEDSSEAAVSDIMKLSDELLKAKDTKQIQIIEGKLMALDQKVNVLSESGPRLRVRAPQHVIVDNMAEEVDLSDASYVIVADYIRTEMMRAVYGTRDPESGEWLPLYDPTHVTASKGKADINGHDDDIAHFSLVSSNDPAEYGYKTKDEFNDAMRTKVWYVWDKTTRRVLMFNDKDWSSPIWVWDDPYKLTRFFPFFPLSFYTDPVERFARSEVMYYLDQQDELNLMNNERARMRHWVLSKVFINTTYIKDVALVQKFLSSASDKTVHGLQLPEGVKLSDAISTLPTPSTQFEGLFDTQPLLQSVGRLSSVTPVLQNEQFKTNTTNKAIESYESSTQTRLDEKIDAIEDVLGDIGVALMEMAVQFMTEDTVRGLIGDSMVDKANGWDSDVRPDQLHKLYNFKIIGGSTLKPTSKVKKDQALALSQSLGQFVQASPPVVIVMLKVLERAFNEDFVITPDEWDAIIQGAQQSAAPAPSANGGGRPPSEGGGGAPDEQAMIAGVETLAQIIDTLDPELKAQVGSAITEGIPLKEIVASLTQQAQGNS